MAQKMIGFQPDDDNQETLRLVTQGLGCNIISEIIRDLIPKADEVQAMIDYIDLANFHGAGLEGLGDVIRIAVGEYLANFVQKQQNVALQMTVEASKCSGLEERDRRLNVAAAQIAFCGKWLKAMKRIRGYEIAAVQINKEIHYIVKGKYDSKDYIGHMSAKIKRVVSKYNDLINVIKKD